MDAGSHGRPRGTSIASTVAVLAVASFVTLSPGATSAAESASSVADDAVGAPIRWGACDPPGPALQCARVAVPLDWKNPRGRTISLAVTRHRASKPTERIGTLFINPGGPGDTGIGLVQGDPEGLDDIGRGRFDVVSWDPRGSNASTRMLCFRDQVEEARFWMQSITQPAPRRGSAIFPAWPMQRCIDQGKHHRVRRRRAHLARRIPERPLARI